jgi:hypothetical protein
MFFSEPLHLAGWPEEWTNSRALTPMVNLPCFRQLLMISFIHKVYANAYMLCKFGDFGKFLNQCTASNREIFGLSVPSMTVHLAVVPATAEPSRRQVSLLHTCRPPEPKVFRLAHQDSPPHDHRSRHPARTKNKDYINLTTKPINFQSA